MFPDLTLDDTDNDEEEVEIISYTNLQKDSQKSNTEIEVIPHESNSKYIQEDLEKDLRVFQNESDQVEANEIEINNKFYDLSIKKDLGLKNKICTKKNKRRNASNHMRNHQCKECQRIFSSIYSLNRHLLGHEGKIFKCGECSKTYASKNQLKKHLFKYCKKSLSKIQGSLTQKELKSDSIYSENNRPYKCCKCSKSYIRKYHLKRHELIHSKNKKPSCNECNKTFKDKFTLKHHSLSKHSKMSKNTCYECRKSLKNKYSLRRHYLYVHSKVKSFKCNKCNEKFVENYQLKNHMISTHSGNKILHRLDRNKLNRWKYTLRNRTLIRPRKTFCCEICSNSDNKNEGHSKSQRLLQSGKKVANRNEFNGVLTKKYKLRNQVAVKSGEQVSSCMLRDKVKTRKYILRKRSSIHPRKSFCCEDCKC